jgi:PAS domain S-box-containing protein
VAIGDAVITADADGRIDYMNPVAEQMTGWWRARRGAGPADRRGAAVVDELDRDARAARESRCCARSRAVASVGPTDHTVLLDRDGRETAIQDSAAPIRDRGGRIVGAVVVFHDVTRERRLRRALASRRAMTR